MTTKRKIARSIVRRLLGHKVETAAERQAVLDLQRLNTHALQNLLTVAKGDDDGREGPSAQAHA